MESSLIECIQAREERAGRSDGDHVDGPRGSIQGEVVVVAHRVDGLGAGWIGHADQARPRLTIVRLGRVTGVFGAVSRAHLLAGPAGPSDVARIAQAARVSVLIDAEVSV